MQQFEFHAYAGDENGAIASSPEVTIARFRTDSAAKNAAGRHAKKIKGPVDIALAGAADWNERYLTTANPSDHHAAGFRFERIA